MKRSLDQLRFDIGCTIEGITDIDNLANHDRDYINEEIYQIGQMITRLCNYYVQKPKPERNHCWICGAQAEPNSEVCNSRDCYVKHLERENEAMRQYYDTHEAEQKGN